MFLQGFANRLLGNWCTSSIAVIILLFASVGVMIGKIEIDSYIAILPTVVILLRAKDTLLGVSTAEKSQSMPKSE